MATKSRYQIIIFLIIILISIYIISQFTSANHPAINDAWVINLDKDAERYAYFTQMAKNLPTTVNRWPGTNGRTETRGAAARDGVSTFLTKSMNPKEIEQTDKILFKPGVIGCWLSHKRLLRHLASLPVNNSYGHFIVEDDIIIPSDFSSRWETIRQTIPTNWDMVYFGAGGVDGDRLNQYVLKWRNEKYAANWGTYAYLVRHGALPFMLSKLQFMDSPIDVQYYRHFKNLNIYIIDPALITTGELETSIGQH